MPSDVGMINDELAREVEVKCAASLKAMHRHIFGDTEETPGNSNASPSPGQNSNQAPHKQVHSSIFMINSAPGH
jgi:hypothetical protein